MLSTFQQLIIYNLNGKLLELFSEGNINKKISEQVRKTKLINLALPFYRDENFS